MNERIQELYTQSLETKFDYSGGNNVKPGEYYSNYKTVLNAEKFAELIVEECANVADENYIHRGSRTCGLAIRLHFGVEHD